MNLAPTINEISDNVSFKESPKPGALVATTLNVPRNLLITIVLTASWSISSQIINNGFLTLTTSSNNGKISWIDEIFWFVTKIAVSSIVILDLSNSPTIYGEI